MISPFVKEALTRSSNWLGLTPKTLTKGFDTAWVEFTKSNPCTSLESWDANVALFTRSLNWRERLQKPAEQRTECIV